MSALSVISSASRLGCSPVSSSTRCTRLGRSPCRNCTGDRLSAICSGVDQEAASRHASRRVHSPIATISPFSSAAGMHPADQRLEADDLALHARLRLVVQQELAAADAEAQIVLERMVLAGAP